VWEPGFNNIALEPPVHVLSIIRQKPVHDLFKTGSQIVYERTIQMPGMDFVQEQ